MKMKLVVLAVVLALPAVAGASTLTFVNPAEAGSIYQQTENSPCVIGDPSCKNPAGLDWTSQSGPAVGGTYDLYSPVYTVDQIMGIVGSAFMVGIDENWANTAETLNQFELLINGTAQFTYTGSDPFAVGNNGNGYSDALLTGFDLSSFLGSDTAQFHAVWSNDSDGMEEFFLISENATPVPEPVTMLLLGTGLLGAGFFRKRRK